MTDPLTRSESPTAVLWDMDGTLVDTEPYWIAAEYDLVEEHGGTWSDEHAMQLVGNDLIVSGRYIRDHAGIDLDAEEIVDELLDRVGRLMRDDVPFTPGARELLAEIARAGIPQGLVTMSWRRFVRPVIDALPADTFATVITGDEVSRGKPDPEPYRDACVRLGLDPAGVIAIEDSLTGATSAGAAGCRVVVVPNHVRVPEAPGRAFLPSLDGVDLAALTAAAPARPGGGAVRAVG